MKRIEPRARAQICAALRVYGRLLERALMTNVPMPHMNPMIAPMFRGLPPMTLDEIETLIGRLDGTWTAKGLRPWNPQMWL